jgi:hypothetical protein
MSFIDSDSVGDQAAVPFFIFAAAAIAGTVTARIPAGKKRGACSADKPTENTNKALKEDWITGIASGDGVSCSEAA